MTNFAIGNLPRLRGFETEFNWNKASEKDLNKLNYWIDIGFVDNYIYLKWGTIQNQTVDLKVHLKSHCNLAEKTAKMIYKLARDYKKEDFAKFAAFVLMLKIDVIQNKRKKIILKPVHNKRFNLNLFNLVQELAFTENYIKEQVDIFLANYDTFDKCRSRYFNIYSLLVKLFWESNNIHISTSENLTATMIQKQVGNCIDNTLLVLSNNIKLNSNEFDLLALNQETFLTILRIQPLREIDYINILGDTLVNIYTEKNLPTLLKHTTNATLIKFYLLSSRTRFLPDVENVFIPTIRLIHLRLLGSLMNFLEGDNCKVYAGELIMIALTLSIKQNINENSIQEVLEAVGYKGLQIANATVDEHPNKKFIEFNYYDDVKLISPLFVTKIIMKVIFGNKLTQKIMDVYNFGSNSEIEKLLKLADTRILDKILVIKEQVTLHQYLINTLFLLHYLSSQNIRTKIQYMLSINTFKPEMFYTIATMQFTDEQLNMINNTRILVLINSMFSYVK